MLRDAADVTLASHSSTSSCSISVSVISKVTATAAATAVAGVSSVGAQQPFATATPTSTATSVNSCCRCCCRCCCAVIHWWCISAANSVCVWYWWQRSTAATL
eukprot:16962-Heterococcus_DN1.PRE.2